MPSPKKRKTVSAMSLRAKCAIAGLGQTRMGKNFDHPGPVGFAAEAVNLALEAIQNEKQNSYFDAST